MGYAKAITDSGWPPEPERVQWLPTHDHDPRHTLSITREQQHPQSCFCRWKAGITTHMEAESEPVTFGEQRSHVIWAGDTKGSHQPDPKKHCLHISCLLNKPVLEESFLLINTSFFIQPFSKRKCSMEQWKCYWRIWALHTAIHPFLKLTASDIPLRPPIRRHQIS